MRVYPLLSPDRAAEIVASIRDQAWTPGVTQSGNPDVKKTEELKHDNAIAKPLLDEIVKAISESPLYQREMLQIAFAPRFSRYGQGGEYQKHSDAAYMGEVRTDLAMTLFLTDEYEGGELCVEGTLPNEQTAKVKAPAGHAVVYECWRPHWVEPVTKGERVVALTWFQSRVKSSEDRDILNTLHSVIDDLTHERMSKQERFAVLGAVHGKLFKRFAA
jgi:PKHD-type hydroxylase